MDTNTIFRLIFIELFIFFILFIKYFDLFIELITTELVHLHFQNHIVASIIADRKNHIMILTLRLLDRHTILVNILKTILYTSYPHLHRLGHHFIIAGLLQYIDCLYLSFHLQISPPILIDVSFLSFTDNYVAFNVHEISA